MNNGGVGGGSTAEAAAVAEAVAETAGAAAAAAAAAAEAAAEAVAEEAVENLFILIILLPSNKDPSTSTGIGGIGHCRIIGEELAKIFKPHPPDL